MHRNNLRCRFQLTLVQAGCLQLLIGLKDNRRRYPPVSREVRLLLILTRRVGETVMIGNDVTVTVLGVKGNQVRVGINAPKNVAVHREEIYERIKREQQGEPAEESEGVAEAGAATS